MSEEQGGKRRADYGKQIIKDLSLRLTQRFGRGWSEPTLWRIRQFFLLYSDSLNTVEGILVGQDSRNTVERIPQTRFGNSVNSVYQIPKFTLGWSHYLLLMRIADPVERAFYEREATERNWSFRQLERMYRTSTFERLQISKDCLMVKLLSLLGVLEYGRFAT